MASEHVVELTDANFQQEVMDSEIPVLVDFWAEWCMPCKMIAPTIDELGEEYAGRVKICKLDTDEARESAMGLGISAIPTLILFTGGEVAKKFVGLQQKAELQAALNEALG
ncbi:MAG: thioredoxin [Planctomycetota bacterium]|jgi:thioredoxin 1